MFYGGGDQSERVTHRRDSSMKVNDLICSECTTKLDGMKMALDEFVAIDEKAKDLNNNVAT